MNCISLTYDDVSHPVLVFPSDATPVSISNLERLLLPIVELLIERFDNFHRDLVFDCIVDIGWQLVTDLPGITLSVSSFVATDIFLAEMSRLEQEATPKLH